MILSAQGNNQCNQLGIEPTTNNKDGKGCVDVLTQVPFDIEGIQCVTTGAYHSVIIKNNCVYAAGDDTDFLIGGDARQTYRTFTEIKISEEPISWAACGQDFTLYLTTSGKVILCHKRAKGEKIIVDIEDKKALAVFSSNFYGAIIDEEGAVHVLCKKKPNEKPIRVFLENPAVDVACSEEFIYILTSDERVFVNAKAGIGSNDFIELKELTDKHIVKLNSYGSTCAALSAEWKVFMAGKNDYGQMGISTTQTLSDFIEIPLNEEIIDVCCSRTTLFLTKSNKILGCGSNYSYQLHKETSELKELTPIVVATMTADQVITGRGHSFVLSGTGKLENPAKVFFWKLNEKQETVKDAPNQAQIDFLVALCQSQAQSIAQLTELCRNLQKQMETNQKELKKEITEIRDEMNSKLDTVVKYINDLDVF